MSIARFRNEFEAALSGLALHDADPKRIERIRVRCLMSLESQQQRVPGNQWFPAAWRRRFELAAACILSAVYLAAAIGSSLALLR